MDKVNIEKTIDIMKNLAFLSGKDSSDECKRAIADSIKALEKMKDLKMDLESEIHRINNFVIGKTTSDEEKVKALASLECYCKVLIQLDD